MKQEDAIALAKTLQKKYPHISIQELFGGIRMDCGDKTVYIDEMTADAALERADAFASTCQQRRRPTR